MDKEDLTDCIKESKKGVYLDLRVSPDSLEDKIEGVNRWRNNLEVDVEERAEGGKANKALVKLLADSLKMSENKIKIVKGKRSKQKRVFISGIDEPGLISRVLEEKR